MIIEVLKHTLLEAIKLLPFLFITYFIMEYIEYKMKNKSKDLIKKSDKFGPIIGSILGVFPQCGFSVSATNLYSGRVITLGTLIAVYLSTSDEMLPILISEAVSPIVILKILGIKLLIGMIFGFIIDFVINFLNIKKNNNKVVENTENSHKCNDENCQHCCCEKNGILKSTILHTVKILIYIIIILFVINLIIHVIGKDKIEHLFLNKPIIGPMISALIGLIPNCAASVIITNMYLQNVISVSSLIAGLLTSAGVGLAVLFKTNKGIKNNLLIVLLLYTIGVFSGIVLEAIGLVI